jgi:hypothetical protein
VPTAWGFASGEQSVSDHHALGHRRVDGESSAGIESMHALILAPADSAEHVGTCESDRKWCVRLDLTSEESVRVSEPQGPRQRLGLQADYRLPVHRRAVVARFSAQGCRDGTPVREARRCLGF